ncbi:MAG TPA: tRNA pseudouridine(38-40) synthase TruA [Hanamia sp.]|nr:tRNA pseudouridine(38-40) synthase TruA [Hanamia sp.]
MPRYFIEVSYKGAVYSGFQVQKNSNTIQAEVERALEIFFKQKFTLTGSSRTDTGVHALQNFFHFDVRVSLSHQENNNEYHLNSILPKDIVIKKIFEVPENMHCRFDAISREYKYFIYQYKNPFLKDIAYYFPYKLDFDKLNKAATLIMHQNDFTSFSKKNTQVKNFICEIMKSEWTIENGTLVYNVKANRFLRGMVKGLVGTMLRVGREIISLEEFEKIFESRDCTIADFSVAPHALFLISINYNGF